MSDGIEALSHVLNLKGKVVPLTEENVILNAEMEDGSIVKGEHHITEDKRKIKRVFYDNDPIPSKRALRAIETAGRVAGGDVHHRRRVLRIRAPRACGTLEGRGD